MHPGLGALKSKRELKPPVEGTLATGPGTAHGNGEENHPNQEKNSHFAGSSATFKKNLKLWMLTVDILSL